MTTLSGEELQQLALAEWSRRRPVSTDFWRRLAQSGLYEWAVQQQAAVFGGATPHVPTKDALLAPPATHELELVSPPPPPARPPADAVPSKRRLNRGRRAAEAVAARQKQEQALAFAPRDFVMFALPHKRSPSSVYERLNGRYRFRIETGGGHAIPFGQDRLFPLWLATAFKAAGQPADNRVRFRSATDILTAFRQGVDGGSTRALHERIERWFHTTLYVYDEGEPDLRRFRSYRLLEGGQLWYHRDGPANQYTLWQNVLDLAPKFADDVRSTTIPVDFETVVALRDMPGALDLYIWQAHRSWELAQQAANRPTVVPLPLLLAQLGTQSPSRKAKQLLKKWQGVVKEVWKGCPNFFDPGQDLFFLHAGRAVFERTTTKLPGVLPEPPVPLRPLQEPSEGSAGPLVLKRPAES